MSFPPIPPAPPVLPVGAVRRRQLEQLAAAQVDPRHRASLARAPWLPAAAAQALALADDPDIRRLAEGFRALAPRPVRPNGPAGLPRDLQALLDGLVRRHPRAIAALKAQAAEARPATDVKSMVIAPTSIWYIVLVPGPAWDEPERAFLEALAGAASTPGQEPDV